MLFIRRDTSFKFLLISILNHIFHQYVLVKLIALLVYQLTKNCWWNDDPHLTLAFCPYRQPKIALDSLFADITSFMTKSWSLFCVPMLLAWKFKVATFFSSTSTEYSFQIKTFLKRTNLITITSWTFLCWRFYTTAVPTTLKSVSIYLFQLYITKTTTSTIFEE